MILINAGQHRSNDLGHFQRYVPVTIPFGLGMLACYLEAKGKSVKVIDECVTPVNEQVIRDSVKGEQTPYVFGISSLTANVRKAYEIARLIKSVYPDSKLMMGGIHPTVVPEEPLQTGVVDIVVRREGEEAVSTLYDRLYAGLDYTDVPSISYMTEDGEVVHNQNGPVIQSLDFAENFPYHHFDQHLDCYNLGFVMSTRGCPYDCIFCSQRSISGKSYRVMTPQSVVNWVDTLVNKYDQKFVDFWDDNFVVKKSWTRELCDLMAEEKSFRKAEFGCYTRGESITDEMLDYMKRAGFSTIGFGIESASNRLMAMVDKGETVEDNIRGVTMAKKAGFKCGGTFIMGLPTETKEDRRATYKLARKLDLDYARFNNATPYPGTQLYELGKKDGGLNLGENWDNLNAIGALANRSSLPYVPPGTDESQLRRDIVKANYFFWLRPKGIKTLLFNGNTTWFPIPNRWYLSPNEWWHLTKFCFVIAGKFVINVLPTPKEVFNSKNTSKEKGDDESFDNMVKQTN